MRTVAAGCLAIACVLAPAGARGQTPLTEHTLTAAEGSARPTLTLASVGWLAGQWRGEGLGAVAEEFWLPAAGGAMAGTFRLVDRGSVRFYELFTLIEEDEEERVEFPLLRAEPAALWFDGLTVQRVDPDEMRVWVALQHDGDGVEEALFRYRRVRLDPR